MTQDRSTPSTRYRTIVADPPWPVKMIGSFAVPGKRTTISALEYPTMTVAEIEGLRVGELAEPECHLWLWTTNGFLESAFGVMRAWGFKYLSTITWVKDAGMGAYFSNTTQHVLFGYRQRCIFPNRRWAPTHFYAVKPRRHSQKPEGFYGLVEEVSSEPRLELFARRQRLGWDTWGDESLEHVELSTLSPALPKCVCAKRWISATTSSSLCQRCGGRLGAANVK